MHDFRPLSESDLPRAAALSALIGWNQVQADWALFLRGGAVRTLDDGDPAGAAPLAATAATIRYGAELAWIAMVLVRPDRRRAGLATALMRWAVESLRGVPCVGLDATPAGREVYRRLGFRDVWGFRRWAMPEALPAEPVAWEPKLEKDHKMPEYNSWWQKVTLKDGTTFTGVFASAQNGSKLVSLAYEQRLRDGPDAESLRQQLYAKYGKADEEAGNRTWLTWWLRSSVNNDPTGAFLKGRLKTGADGKVELLTLSLSDYALVRRDEAQAAAARRQADREAIEKKKSDGVKF